MTWPYSCAGASQVANRLPFRLPWVGAVGMLATFETTRELSLVNCTERSDSGTTLGLYLSHEPTGAELERYAWEMLNNSFSEPVTSTETTAHYAPTQVVAEMFRSAGLDGVL